MKQASLSLADGERTRHDGVRRTRVAQQLGIPGLVTPSASEAVAKVGESGSATPVSTLEERHTDIVKVGGSNPSPRTPRFKVGLNEPLGLTECPYAVRWYIETRHGSVRLHHWLAPDDPRAVHDHPWAFTTLVLRGGYTDVSPTGTDHLRAPTVRHRAATHRHTVVPDPGGAWTLVITGPKVRAWGFWRDGVKFIKANKWFLSHGHHPCS